MDLGFLPMFISDFRVYNQIKDIDELITMGKYNKDFNNNKINYICIYSFKFHF